MFHVKQITLSLTEEEADILIRLIERDKKITLISEEEILNDIHKVLTEKTSL